MATVGAASAYNALSGSTERTPNSNLDKDAFLQLLVTTLQYQDPLNPTEDKDFLAQMAQFSSLEQMQNMSKAATQSQAYGMIGKTITATVYDEKTANYVEVEGRVTSIVTRSGEAYLTVGTYEIPIGKVETVREDYYQAAQLEGIYGSIATSQNLSLIGQCIQAITVDADGNAKEFIEGKVDYVKFSGGQTILVVGDKEIFGNEVTSVSKDKMLLGKKLSFMETDEETGETNTVLKEISDVKLVEGKANLVVDGELIPVDKINYVTEALQLVDKTISHAGTTGKVSSVTIKNGIPHMVVNGTEISYVSYKGIGETSEE